MKKFVMIALAAALVSGSALAQAPSAAPAKPSLMARMKAAHAAKVTAKPATAKPAMTAVPAAKPAANNNGQRTAKSLACSKQADAKNIHGKARKSFMSHCKKA